MANLSFSCLNNPGNTPDPAATAFTLNPETPTDIWRKPGPPEVSTFNAPIFYKTITLRDFKSLRVTVSADWKALYDQGGLVFILPTPGSDIKESKWIKTGIEFYLGSAYVSTVVKDRSADWSLAQTNIKNGKEVTLLVERHEKDDTLWIYAVDGENKAPLREVTWILSEDGNSEVWVGVYAARPMPGDNLEVKFEAFELQLL